MIATNRVYTDVETKEMFRLYSHPTNHSWHLISEGNKNIADGCEVNGFYLCAFDSVTIKINGSKIVSLGMGNFYNLKEGEIITHNKFAGFKKFTRV